MRKIIIWLGSLIILVLAYFFIDGILFDGVKSKSINHNGFQAKYYAQEGIKNKTTIILLGGGSWGDYWGSQFAKKGFVGLSLPYTGKAGLPKLPEEIPLEYFENAIDWLGARAEVNPVKIIVMGASRNAELALIIASTFPEMINGVIAYSPSSVSWSNTVLPFNSDSLRASWTYKGEDIPYVPMEKIKGGDSSTINTLDYWKTGLKKSNYIKAAQIKVEEINGPILLQSGKDDLVWPSSLMADMIEKRIRENNFKYSIKNVQYERSGHLISRNPDSNSNASNRKGKMTINNKEYKYPFGGTMEGDNSAKILARIEVFKFIEQL